MFLLMGWLMLFCLCSVWLCKRHGCLLGCFQPGFMSVLYECVIFVVEIATSVFLCGCNSRGVNVTGYKIKQ